MAKPKSKTKDAPRKTKYDQSKILKLWEDGKSIREISEAMKPISKVFVHRVLTMKFPAQYKAGQKARADAREKSKAEKVAK